MRLIQIIFFVFVIFVLIRVSAKFKRSEISLKEWLIWTIFWLIIAVVTLLPQTIDILAQNIGLQSGRGVDLAVYVSIPVLFYIIFRLFVKVDRTERQLTEIVRQIALKFNQTDNKDDINAKDSHNRTDI